MKSRNIAILATFLLVAMTLAPVSVNANPVINSITPDKGSVNGGTEVTVTGTGFQQGAIVEVDGTLATGITVTSATSLKFKTPSHAIGNVNIKITNPDGVSTTFGTFAYQAATAPTITSGGVTPSSGSPNGGTTVTITGTNFHTDPFPRVTFAGTPAIVTAATSTSITAIAPAGTPSSFATVIVRNPDLQEGSLASAFAYTGISAPTVTGRDPTTATADGGVTVTITGTNFAPGAGVTFGVTPSEKVTFISPTQITALAPPLAAGAHDIVVTNPDGGVTGAISFTYNAATAPTFTSVSPVKGPTVGGTELTIIGTGFKDGATVTVGATAALSTTFVSATQLKAVAPAGTVGAKNIIVTNPSTLPVTGTGVFTYVTPVRIDSLSAANGPSIGGGPSVVITGTGFTAGARVFFGTVEAEVTATTVPTSITVTLPPQASGGKDVRVVNSDGATARITNAFTYSTSAAPTVTSVAPNEGIQWGGEEITITGTGFSTASADHKPTVKFGTAAAGIVPAEDVTVTSATEIKVKAPARPNAANANVLVQVTNPDGQASSSVTCGTASTPPAGCYRYQQANAPNGVGNPDPAGPLTLPAENTGDTNGGTTVTITGTGFAFQTEAEDKPAKPVVRFGNIVVDPDDVTVNSGGSITVKAPAHTAALPSNPNLRVSVTNPDGRASITTACGTGDSPVPAGCFRYTAATAPSITSLSRTTGSANGDEIATATLITISGTGFAHAADPNTPAKPVVRFGSVTVPEDHVTVTGPTAITVFAPGGAAGIVSVRVTNPDGKTHELPSAFTYDPAANPAITMAAPNTAPLIGGTTVTITGTGFAAGTPYKPTVVIGGTTVDPDDVAVNVGGTEITAITPSRPSAGSAHIQVVNPSTLSVGFAGANGLAYLPEAPSVTSLSATTGSLNGGNSVTITGTNLGLEGPSVLFGTKVATIKGTPAATSIPVQVPFGAGIGSVGVSVVDQNGQSASRNNAYTYQTAPPSTFTSLSPITGSINGGATVTVTGQNFVNGATVTVDGKAATNIAASTDGKTLSFTVPSHTLGPKDVVIDNPTGPDLTIVRGFGYLGTAGPVVTSVTPNTGPVAGGTAITIAGQNFGTGATVTVGGTAAVDVVRVSATQITAKTPAGTAGATTVVVTNADGQSASQPFTYTGDAAPTITAPVSPTSGSTNGGTVVTITGTNFVTTGTTAVTFGGTAGTDVTVVSATQLTVKTPARSTAGAVDVRITNPDGQNSNALTGAFTYTLAPAPTVTLVEPDNGTANGGTEVTITGTGFALGAAAPAVTFGGTAATDVTVVSATQITAKTPGHAAGAVDVIVTNPDTQASAPLVDGFEFIMAPPPVVTGINPSEGPASGGTVVTITGTDFASSASVTFGGAQGLSVTVAADGTSITVTAPARAAGAGVVDVVVRNPDTQTATSLVQFTYTAVETVTPAQIMAANQAVQDSVMAEAVEDGIAVTWDSSLVPSGATGVQIWRINSPAVWVADVLAGSTQFTDGRFVDTNGNEDSQYLVTVFFGNTLTLGYSTNAITDLPGYQGLSEEEVADRASPSAAESDGSIWTTWWFWLLLVLGLFVLVGMVVLAVVMTRRSGEDESAGDWDAESDLGWADEEGLAAAPAAAWEEPVQATEEIHHMECPQCGDQFSAVGPKPLVTNCPGCGTRGVLR